MKEYVFNCYNKFHCIAEKCKHSCCEKWDIDIDKKSLKKYKRVKGDFKERILSGIDFKNKKFLKSSDRCAFLNDKGLCDLYTALGEKSLCQVCTDHPRFRTFYGKTVETGIGLTCEEGCRLVLDGGELLNMVCVFDDGKKEKLKEFELLSLNTREKVLNIIRQDLGVEDIVNEISDIAGYDRTLQSVKKWATFLQKLEILDESWNKELKSLNNFSNGDKVSLESFSLPLKNLLSYFCYRHLLNAQNREDLNCRIAFIVFSYDIITSLLFMRTKDKGKCEKNDLLDITRSFSSEIEYSCDNYFNVLDELQRLINIKRYALK